MTDDNLPNDHAERKTDLAEDRTLLANERTFAGWVRTGLASVGIGLGFHALFEKMEPSWLPRAISTCFILAGITIFYFAERNSRALLGKLDAHAVEPVRRMNLRIVAVVVGGGSFILLAGIWLLV